LKSLVSIIIPTYKRPFNLRRAIWSALKQSYTNIEVIVVDDNDPSTINRERTENTISDFEDKRLKYIKHKYNRNGAAARNTGIKNANGYYIAFLDDDDEFEKDKIKKQFEYLSTNHQFMAVYCKATHYKNDKLYYKTNFNKEGDLQYDILAMKQELYTPSLLVNTAVLKAIDGFDEGFDRHQDYELLLRLTEKYKIGCLNEYLLKIHNDDTQNQPTFSEFEKIKKSFLTKFTPYINKYNKRKKRAIYSIHYFDLFYYALKKRKIRKAIYYLIRSKPNLSTFRIVSNKFKKIIKRVLNK
jgi:glycosyltransferase involved in cell wall biosynthesis